MMELKVLDELYEVVSNTKLEESDTISKRDVHYFQQGIKVALRLIKQEDALITDELFSYEFVEKVLRAVKDNLDENQVMEIVEDVYE